MALFTKARRQYIRGNISLNYLTYRFIKSAPMTCERKDNVVINHEVCADAYVIQTTVNEMVVSLYLEMTY